MLDLDGSEGSTATGGCSGKRSRRAEKRQPVKQTELCAFFAETGPDSEHRPELATCKE